MLIKRQKKKALVIMMIFCMAFTMMPAFAFAAPETDGAAAEETSGESTDGAAGQAADGGGETAPSAEDGHQDKADAAGAQNAGAGNKEPETSAASAGEEAPAEPAAEETGQTVDEGTGDVSASAETAQAPEAPKSKAVRMLAAPKAENTGKAGVSVGDKIEYKGKKAGKDETAIFSFKETDSGKSYTGTCRVAGLPMDKSGTGTVESRISNNSKIAKVIYKYAVVGGWLTGKKATKNARKVLGLNYKIGFTYRRLIEAACQINNMGKKDFKNAMMNVGGVSEPTVEAMCDWYKDLDVSNVTVPDEFEIYQIDTKSGVQPFTMWAYTPSEGDSFVKVKKVSGNEALTGSAGSMLSAYSLEGAEYQIFKDSSCTQPLQDEDGEDVILETTRDGESEAVMVNPGTYYIKETVAGDGFAPDATVYTVTVTDKNTEDDPAVFTSTEPPLYGEPDFAVFKADVSGKADYTKLEGAEFTVRYYDVAEKADIAGAQPKEWWTFKAKKMDAPDSYPEGTFMAGIDWQKDSPEASGRQDKSFFHPAGDDSKRILPLGWFTIEETKAPNGFRLTDRICYGHIYRDTDGSAKTVLEDAAADTRLGKDVYIFDNEPVYTKIRKTDSASGKPLSGAGLQLLDSSGAAADAWTTDGKDHVIEGLAPGSYTLREVSAPYGYETADDITFTLAEGEDKSVEMKNTPVTVSTTAVSASTGMHIGAAKADEKITDTVHMTGLVKDREYRLDGQLIRKSTGDAVSGASASKEFTATASEMDVKMDLAFDATKLESADSLVVYETLYRTSKVHDEKVPVELAKHHDINDAGQTVMFPKISTSASIQNDNREIKDIVTYEGVMENKSYVIRGWLVDTATGEKVPDSDGMIKLESGDKTSGKAEMILKTEKYDGMKGYSMTAFEELYIVINENGSDKEILIAEHKDRSDSKQTVEIYQDLKVKKNVTGNLGDLTKLFEYKAEFTGLVPDEAYKVEGDDEKTFMADASGKASVDLKLRDGQKAVIKKLPKGAAYKVTEAASDHIAEYRMFSEDMADKGAKIITAEASNGAEAAKMLATAEETVDLFYGTIVILWENNRDLATLTGVRTYPGIWAEAFALVLAGAAVIMKRRRYYGSEAQ